MCLVPKKSIDKPDCIQLGDIEDIFYSSRDGNTYTFGQTAVASRAKELITDITVTPTNGFYNLYPHKEGDAKPTFSTANVLGEDGSSDRTNDFGVRFASDTPENRAVIAGLYGKVVDLLVVYKGESGYKYEMVFDMVCTEDSRNEKRRQTALFKRINPDLEPLLVWKTDFAATKTLVEGIIED